MTERQFHCTPATTPNSTNSRSQLVMPIIKCQQSTCNANQSLKTGSGEKEINYIGQATLHKCGAVGKTFNPRTGCALFDRSVSAFAMHWSLRWPRSLDLGGRSSSWCLWRCVKPQLFHPPMRCDSMPWSDIAEDSNEPENIHKEWDFEQCVEFTKRHWNPKNIRWAISWWNLDLLYDFPESPFCMYFNIISWQRKQTKKMLFQHLNFSIQIPRRSNSILATVLFTT